MTRWIEQIANHDISQHAGTVGLTPVRRGSFRPCPACGEEKRGSEDQRGPIGLTGDNKGWKCHRCDARGDLADIIAYAMFGDRVAKLTPEQRKDLRERAAQMGFCTGANPGTNIKSPTQMATRKPPTPAPAPTSPPATGKGPFTWRESLVPGSVDALWNNPDCAPVLEYLRTKRLFSDAVIKRWGLGAVPFKRGGKVVERWLVIPLLGEDGNPCNARFRSVPGPCLHCSPDGVADGPGCKRCATKAEPGGTGEVQKAYRVCPGRPLPLFGMHNLKDVSSPVIVTEGELDVLALDELGWPLNVCSGTAGADSSWPDAWLDRLEPFPSFVLAYDDDEAGNRGAEKLADKLGRYRCARARLPFKDANECLVKGVPFAEVKDALDRAGTMTGLTYARPSDFDADIEQLINNPNQLKGLQLSLQRLNDLWGGLIPGCHVVTGETGDGKTTFTHWAAWDVATHLHEPVFVTSFEQRPIGSVQKFLRMEVGGDFTTATRQDRIDGLARLDAKRIWILDHYGEMSFDRCLDASRYARRRLGARVQVIDHLGFLTRVHEGSMKDMDERTRIEYAIRTLALVGVNEDIVYLLICHPNNMSRAQQRRVELGDVKGASAVRQDCHSGIVVEKGQMSSTAPYPTALVYFDKVRSEFGRAGTRAKLVFDPLALHYHIRWDLTPSGKKGVTFKAP